MFTWTHTTNNLLKKMGFFGVHLSVPMLSQMKKMVTTDKSSEIYELTALIVHNTLSSYFSYAYIYFDIFHLILKICFPHFKHSSLHSGKLNIIFNSLYLNKFVLRTQQCQFPHWFSFHFHEFFLF